MTGKENENQRNFYSKKKNLKTLENTGEEGQFKHK